MITVPEDSILLAVEKQAINRVDYNVNYVGSILRYVRLERNLTLNEIKADCCIAYLSKLERNLIDNPDEKIIRQICKQLRLDYDKVMMASNGNILFDLIKCLCINDIDGIINIHNMIDDNIPYSLRILIEIVYYYIMKDEVNFSDFIRKFDLIKHTASKTEFSLFIMVYVIYFTNTFQFEKARRYLSYFKRLNIDNKYLDCIYLENKFVISCLSYESNMKEDYLELKKYYDYFYPNEKKEKMRLIFASGIDCDLGLEILECMKNDKYNIDDLDYVYTLCVLYARKLEFDKIINILNNNIKSIKFLAIYAYSIYNMDKLGEIGSNDKKMYLKEIKKNINSIKCKSDEIVHYYITNYLIYVLEDSQESFVINYIKEDLIKNIFSNYDNQMYKTFIINEYVNLIGNSGKYKDAYILIKTLLMK